MVAILVPNRLTQKLKLITNMDSFEIGKATADECKCPLVDVSGIVSYLVLQTSFITAEQYKVHRSLEAHNQFLLVDGLRTYEHTVHQ